ncbi:hypothetical protein GCM10009730_42220 [Streptomyces albidochromogenes]
MLSGGDDAAVDLVNRAVGRVLVDAAAPARAAEPGTAAEDAQQVRASAEWLRAAGAIQAAGFHDLVGIR